MDDDKRSELLAQEYLLLQKTIDDFDQKALTIKAWSVTFGAAGLSLSYAEGAPDVLLVAAAGAIVFWLVEALWKTKQFAHYGRRDDIEAYFARGEPTQPFKIGESWHNRFKARKGYWFALRMMRLPQIALPHVVVLLAGLALYALYPPHKAAPEPLFLASEGS